LTITRDGIQIDRLTISKIILWIAVAIGFSFWILVPPWDKWAGAFGAAYGAIGMIAKIFVIGLPFSLGVALVYTTPNAKKSFAQKSPERRIVGKILVSRFIFLAFVFSLYVSLVSVMMFGFQVGEYSHVDPSLIYAYIPGAIVSGIVISLIITSLLIPILLAVDEWRVGTLLGSAFLFGLSGFGASSYSVGSELALFSPFHLYRFLAIALSGNVTCPTMGQIWGDPDRMHMIMDLYVEWGGLVVPLVIYGIIAFVMLILSVDIFRTHHTLWKYDSSVTQDWRPDEVEDRDVSLESRKWIRSISNAKAMVKRQRQIVVVIILVIFIGAPIVTMSYERQREAEQTHVLFEDSSQTIVLGEFYYGEVEVPAPPIGMYNMWQIETIVLDWGSCPEPLQRWGGFEDISLEEYLTLNETEREKLAGSGHLSITRDHPLAGSGWHGFCDNDSGLFVWHFKYNSTESIAYSITVSIKISVRAM
jgi:hypothetical protein